MLQRKSKRCQEREREWCLMRKPGSEWLIGDIFKVQRFWIIYAEEHWGYRWLKRKGTKLQWKFTFYTDSFGKVPHLHQKTSLLFIALRCSYCTSARHFPQCTTKACCRCAKTPADICWKAQDRLHRHPPSPISLKRLDVILLHPSQF